MCTCGARSRWQTLRRRRKTAHGTDSLFAPNKSLGHLASSCSCKCVATDSVIPAVWAKCRTSSWRQLLHLTLANHPLTDLGVLLRIARHSNAHGSVMPRSPDIWGCCVVVLGNRRCATCYRSRFETMCFGMNEAGATHCQHEPCGRAPQSECGWSIIVHYDDLPPVLWHGLLSLDTGWMLI